MKKILLSTSVIFIFGLYILRLHTPDGDNRKVIIIATPTPGSNISNNSMMQNGMMNGQQTMMTSYKNGIYTGDVADAFYGNVQVEVTISGGKISDVKFLQYPNDRQTSIEINSQATPMLIQEAIQAQSAQVDGVSGATQTSIAFRQSLQSALSKAVQ